MKEIGVLCVFVQYFFLILGNDVGFNFKSDIINVKTFAYWPNATIPFYINPDHFDHEQSLSIMTALSMFSFKTCLKFVPVMVPPEGNHHALVFTNSEGKRRCEFNTYGHSVLEPHTITLGYDCLKSPQIDMMIMRALGFPFEHNRASRDLYVEVLMENIEPGAIELFTKNDRLPLELRSLPYDFDSVLHFGNRDYSKNGHRTMIFKDHNIQQNRLTLTPTDLRKIEVVYGPECLKRDRQEKIELCQSYPGVARRKRSVELEENKSLRVNPEITPPPEMNTTEIDEVLNELGIAKDVDEIVEQVYKVSSLALSNARLKYCNKTKPDLRIGEVKPNRSSDILGIVEVIAEYAKHMVDNALTNLTEFCESSQSIDAYQRARCPFYDPSGRCRKNYLISTKSGRLWPPTKHRPVIVQSTKHDSRGYRPWNNKVKRSRPENTSDSDSHDIQVKERKRRQAEDSDEKQFTKGLERRTDTDKNVEKTAVDTDLKDAKTEAMEGNVTAVTNNNGTVVEKKDLRMGITVVRMLKRGYRRSVDAQKYRGRKRKATTPESVETSSEEVVTEPVKKETKPLIDIDISKSKEKKERGRKRKPTTPESEETSSEEEVVTEPIKKKRKPLIDIDINKLKQKQERLVNKAKLSRLRLDNFVPRTVTLSKANKEFYDERKWPNGVVRYIISLEKTKRFDIEDMRRRLEEVNDILRKKTCVKLLEVSEGGVNKDSDHLVIDTSPDYVTGRVGGRQNFGSIELFRGGQHRQHAAMMIMAMLGFYFEVARHDRDKHIRVHMRHVRPDKLHHFEKIREDATMALSYDYKSATHPAWQFWRQIGRTGISTVATFKEQDPDGSVMKSLGQNEELLSVLDIVKINSVYGVKCFKSNRSSKENVTETEI